MLVIVPDSNSLYTDPFLERPRIRTILAAEPKANVRLAVPAVVLDELQNQVQDRLNSVVSDVDKAHRKLAELNGLYGYDSYGIDLSVTSEQRDTVIDRFDQRREELNAEQRILSYPSISSEELSRRSIQSRSPFDSKDRGLRDTIIWLSIVEFLLQQAAETRPQILLVSEDAAFWNDSRQELHNDLKEDLRLKGLPEDSVIIRKNLNEVTSEFIASKLSPSDWVKAAIEGGRVPDFVDQSDEISILAYNWLSANSEIFEGDAYTPSEYLWVEFDVIENICRLSIESTLEIGDDFVVVNSTWKGDASVQGIVATMENLMLDESLNSEVLLSVTSILKTQNGDLTVESHEVNNVDILETSRR